MTRVVITQSNYLPWKGYFDLIASADSVIFYDTAQYSKGTWRNRNRIKTDTGLKWLTVPVKTQGLLGQPINQVKISNQTWVQSHIGILHQNYKQAPFYSWTMDVVEPVLNAGHTHLSQLNIALIRQIFQVLDISTSIYLSSDIPHSGNASQKVLALCKAANAQTYISGPAAKAYLSTDLLSEHEIETEWFDYSGYPSYPQLGGTFEHNVSIFDLLANCGPEAIKYMKLPRP